MAADGGRKVIVCDLSNPRLGLGAQADAVSQQLVQSCRLTSTMPNATWPTNGAKIEREIISVKNSDCVAELPKSIVYRHPSKVNTTSAEKPSAIKDSITIHKVGNLVIFRPNHDRSLLDLAA